MKLLTITLAIVGAVLLTTSLYKISQSTTSVTASSVPQAVRDSFDQWRMSNGKAYGAQSDYQYRLGVYAQNYSKVNKKNSEKRSYRLALNKFADMSAEEFRAQYLGMQGESTRAKNVIDLSHVQVSSEVDWTNEGAVTPVKDQGQCGSCWAFSTTGSLEGLAYIQSNWLWYFSEQQLVDCASSYGNAGCSGGLMDHAFLYTAAKGNNLEAEYAYTAQDGTCKEDVELKARIINKGHADVAINDNDALKAAISMQPVSVGIEADDFQFYHSGVFSDWDQCGDQLNHGVLAVGYGTDSASGKMFWKIKNSWGGSWGESGFFRLERKETGEGICGITKNASYPTTSA
jgi:C1A family cysteine protease